MASIKTAAMGKRSAFVSGCCAAVFGLLIILDFFVHTIMYQYLVCLVLAISYVVVANCLSLSAGGETKAWGRVSCSFAVLYAAFICLVYYTQLTVVRMGLVPAGAVALVEFKPGNWLFAVDMLGYTFLALSTLAASFLFRGKGGRLEKAVRALMIAHGALAVPVSLFPALPLFGSAENVQSASLGGSFALLAWCAVFVPLCFLLARYFTQKEREARQEEPPQS